ncbi:hypothetical protein C0992_001442 [Termitomyces sp. T32_za158]|nr:hypothetical protein C0992_001442 [Termitomyces sp. T32_za158]
MDAWPLIGSAGWKTASLADVIGDSAYQNSDDSDSPVTSDDVVAGTTVPVSHSSSSAQAFVGQTTAAPSSSSPSPSTQVAIATPAVSPTTPTVSAVVQSIQTSNAASPLAIRSQPWGLFAALMAAFSVLA